jgi:hypothetical protein
MKFEDYYGLVGGIAGALSSIVIVRLVRGAFVLLGAATTPWRVRRSLARALAKRQEAITSIAEHAELRPLPPGCSLWRPLVLFPDRQASDPFADIRQTGDETWIYQGGQPREQDWKYTVAGGEPASVPEKSSCPFYASRPEVFAWCLDGVPP